jgi:hypothetical protein
VCGHVKEAGGCPRRVLKLAPRTRVRAVGRQQPGDNGVGSRAREAGEEREKGEGGGDRRVGLTHDGAQLIEARERVTDGAGYSVDGLN